jgi:hypothetical protein
MKNQLSLSDGTKSRLFSFSLTHGAKCLHQQQQLQNERMGKVKMQTMHETKAVTLLFIFMHFLIIQATTFAPVTMTHGLPEENELISRTGKKRLQVGG